MDSDHSELLIRLSSFDVDDAGASFPFSSRLAHENGWSISFAFRAIDEYKRFAFLAVAAGHRVSPSEVVDEVWHLHLLYSENYWDVFCKKILRRPLHHYPSKGGSQETEKFEDWYGKTIESYEAFFGHSPPLDIWPSPKNRPKPQLKQRVNRNDVWIIKKPIVWRR